MSTWPELPLESWWDTQRTLHRWTQVVGKIRLALTPTVNHWWNVPLYITARGLTTSEIPIDGGGFDIEFDFHSHLLRIRTTAGAVREIPLEPQPVADFYSAVFATLEELEIDCRIQTRPVELLEGIIPLDRDTQHRSYEREPVERFQRILTLIEPLFTKFRAQFVGKCSPVHFFWGSFDLAVTRFSGRPAPPREDADSITREAYSHEVSSVGWWPGDIRLPLPSFYSYAAPEPAGFRDWAIPRPAYYHPELGGFYLHYDEVRRAADPEGMLLEFCQSTYAAAAVAGEWDRTALERHT